MNKDIVNILRQCRVAIIPDNIEDLQKLTLHKQDKIEIEVGCCYSIHINHDKLVDFDMQINHNISDLDIEVRDMNDRFIKVFSPVWEGWIPKVCIQITKKL